MSFAYSYANTGTGSGMSTSYAWNTWVAITSAQVTTTIWDSWVQVCQPGLITQGTLRALGATEHQRAVAVAAAEFDARSRAAQVRARALLVELLSPEQRESMERHGRIHVTGSKGRRYCIRTNGGQSGNVDWLDPANVVLGSFCAHPTGVPDEDAWLAQKLHIETDEDDFLRRANCSGGRRPELEPVAAVQGRDLGAYPLEEVAWP